MEPLKDYLDAHGEAPGAEIEYWQCYLRLTDYVAAKLAEAAYTGERLGDDYSEVIRLRKEARDKINELQAGKEVK